MRYSTIEVTGNILLDRKVKINGCVMLNPHLNITGEVMMGGGGRQYPVYTGEYVITPLAFIEQRLDTDQKLMEDDVRVLEIPYEETSNTFGTSAIIAS